MTALAKPLEITEPGAYDLAIDAYHADPVPGGSLSSTGARKLLPPSCPQIFAYERDNPPEPTKTFDFGHAAHDAVLGKGPEIVEVKADSWRTNAAKDAGEAARERGAVPLLTKDYQQVQAMAEALRAHPIAGKLLAPGTGVAEESIFWRDEQTGIWRRARPDWRPVRKGRAIIVDYKSARSAEPGKFARAAVDYGYHCQAPWYLDAARAVGLADDDAAFVFVVQEKNPPYVVTVVELDTVAMRIGAALNRRAIDIYAHCTETGHWPGYADDVVQVCLPHWFEREHEEEI